jgi:hypothetical protein
VRGRAMSIRRKRRVAVAGGVLAGAAVVVPAAIVAGNALGDGGDSAPRPADTPTATDSPTPSEPEAVGTGYLDRKTYHRPDGTAFELPEATYQTAATIGDQVLATRTDDKGDLAIDVVGAEGTVVDTISTTTYPVTSSSGEVVAFIDPDGDLRAMWDGGDAVLAEGISIGNEVVAVTGGPTCDAKSDCRVYLKYGDQKDPVVVAGNGETSRPVPDALTITGATDDGLVSVVNEFPGDLSSCGGVYDTTAGEYLFETCDYTVEQVAPDGRHAIATTSYPDGFGVGWVVILDMEGTEVARLEPEDGVLPGGFAWLDDERLAAPVHLLGARTWELATLAVDGSIGTVAGPVKGSVDDIRFFLTG